MSPVLKLDQYTAQFLTQIPQKRTIPNVSLNLPPQWVPTGFSDS